MGYKLIVSDLDETLLNTDKQVGEKTIAAVKKAEDAGVLFIPATGRGYTSVHSTTKALGLYDQSGQYVISFNGGAITENKNEKLLFKQGISFEEAEALYQKGLTYKDICIHIYTLDHVYVRNFYDNEKRYLNGRMQVEEIFSDSIDFLKDQYIIKAIYMNEDFNYLNRIRNEISDLTVNMDVSFSSNRYMEFNRKGVSKGTGLEKLCHILNIPIEETIAIGDNFNDLSMIQTAGLGVGVANTVEDMKSKCDVITKNDCNHDAVAEVINRYIFHED